MPIVDVLGPQVGRSLRAGANKWLNVYPEDNHRGGIRLIGTPGAEVFVTLPSDIRGMLSISDDVFVVSGRDLYKINKSGQYVNYGTMMERGDSLHMAVGGDEILITNGIGAYVFNIATLTFDKVSSPPDSPINACFFDGFFIVSSKGTDRFYISAQYDAKSWNPLDFASAEASGDEIERIVRTYDNIYIFGKKTVEVWYNSGDMFPFSRVSGATSNIGTIAPASVAQSGDATGTIAWLASAPDGGLYVAAISGGAPRKISTSEIDYFISKTNTPEWSVGVCYSQEGHFFYILNINGLDESIVFDFTTGMWHFRSVGEKKLDVMASAVSGGCPIIGGQSGVISKLSLSVFKHNGETIRRVITTQHIGDGTKQYRFNSVWLNMESGHSIPDTLPNPQIFVEVSNDFGYTWGNPIHRSAGASGTYNNRSIWFRCGHGFWKTFRFTISDPIPTVILDLNVEVQ